MKKKKASILSIVFCIIWIGVIITIFIFSNQTVEKSYKVSSSVVNEFNQEVNHYIEWDSWREIRAFIFVHARKFAHIFLYSMLAVTCAGFFIAKKKIKRKYAYIITLIINGLYAALDEVHQIFVPGRGASILDVGRDCIGVLIGICFCEIILRIVRRTRRKEP